MRIQAHSGSCNAHISSVQPSTHHPLVLGRAKNKQTLLCTGANGSTDWCKLSSRQTKLRHCYHLITAGAPATQGSSCNKIFYALRWTDHMWTAAPSAVRIPQINTWRLPNSDKDKRSIIVLRPTEYRLTLVKTKRRL
ncbi:unnamed protein product [Pleuronectes platessa]|uniref:Uncharacterized protein n=1 Tax=Pleuronectes platessa TaxID=8262 RepID=A0A9N7U4U0_PLEPL|nr:unnamed protein product [Pleuronectes platessa]